MRNILGELIPVFTGTVGGTAAAFKQVNDATNNGFFHDALHIIIAASIATVVGILIKNVLWDLHCKKYVTKWMDKKK